MDLLHRIDGWGPEKVVCVSDPRAGMRGVLVIDNTARGMGKGGTRYSPTLSVEEVARLARVMTWKWAGADLFYGGAKAGILASPDADKEEVLRSFARALSNEIPDEYVFGLDMGLTEDDAAVVVDELGYSAAVGTPAALGGVPYDRLGVTGFGVAEAALAAVETRGDTLEGQRVAIHGFGAVGRAAARRFAELGARVVAVASRNGGLAHEDGFDVASLLEAAEHHGDEFVDRMPVGRRISAEEVLVAAADILVPAAMQDVIDASTARAVSASVVVEGANMPADREAIAVLAERGITVVPDMIANAGGAIAAAFAMDFRTSPFSPDPEDIFAMIRSKARSNTQTVLERASVQGIDTHRSARSIAQDRVRAAMEARGQRAPEADS